MKDNDISHQLPVPEGWRLTLQEVVKAFCQGDYGLVQGVAGVLPIPADVAVHNAEFVVEYGQELLPLPEETWATSCCVRFGEHWDAIVDLWTRGEGRSDMVLAVRATPVDGSEMPVLQVGIIYVP